MKLRWFAGPMLLAVFAGPAAAQTGSPPTRTDLTPAAPTQNAGPDAGQSYQYPPNTGNILTPSARTPYDPPPTPPGATSSPSAPGGNPTATSVAK